MAATPAVARLDELAVVSRAPYAGGRELGRAGAYERIVLRGRFSVDPALPINRRIADIALAPRDGAGRVRFESEIVVLQPVDASRSNGTAFIEAVNRGTSLTGQLFGPPERDGDGASAGRQYPLDRGYTFVFAGWQTLGGRNRERLLGLHAPKVPVTGPVRAGRLEREAAPRWSLGDEGDYCPAPGSQSRARLGYRTSLAGRPVWIPASQWRFVAGEGDAEGQPCTVELSGGFRASIAYELVYQGENPIVAGLGLAVLRDVASAIKDPAVAARLGPVRPALRTIGFGYSQGGRLLRQLVHDGFNQDEAGRRAFDGLFVAAAGAGRASVNHRHAQPGRAGNSVGDFHRPVDLFPFADARQRDPATGASGGQLDRARRAGVVPRIFHVLTSTEYWARNASLLHTDVGGRRDIALDPSSRLYLIAGTQHSGAGLRLRSSAPGWEFAYPVNPFDNQWAMRALLDALDQWVRGAAEPPPSLYPTIRAGTLVSIERAGFPRLQGVDFPAFVPGLFRLDFGRSFASSGIIANEPPLIGARYARLVPAVDADGNELAGIRMPRVTVPLAAYTGWNHREPRLAKYEQLAGLYGAIFPLPRDAAERARTGDPRAPISARYRDRADYLRRVRRDAELMAARRLALPEDVPLIVEDAGRYWDMIVDR